MKKVVKAPKPFKISRVYLLDSDGIEIVHKDISLHSGSDADIFNSMFQAVKIYIKKPSHPYGQLRNIRYGGYKILVEGGKEFFLVVIGKGDMTDPVREDMKRIVGNLNKRNGEVISQWKGDVNALNEIGKEFNMLIESQRDEWDLMMGDQHQSQNTKGKIVSKKSRIDEEAGEEIRIPRDYIDRIDRIIDTGMSIYSSRKEFIKSAVEIKLKELKG